jgi:hypothetical protein
VQANTARSAHKQATKKKPVSMLLNALAIGLAVLVAAIGLLLAAGQAGLLRGKPPTLLGVQGGRLPPPHATRNNVHSQAGIWGAQYAHTAIEPLPAQADGAQTMERLRSLVEAEAAAEARGDHDGAQAAARRHLELEPWHEGAHRTLMRALAQPESGGGRISVPKNLKIGYFHQDLLSFSSGNSLLEVVSEAFGDLLMITLRLCLKSRQFKKKPWIPTQM